jgi:hypothetical protein
MYGIINFGRIDTNPDAASAFAPPADFAGEYAQYMRQRWKSDAGVRQHVAVVGRLLAMDVQVVFCGRHADEAKRIVEAVWKQ